jgi:hypothetical protein
MVESMAESFQQQRYLKFVVALALVLPGTNTAQEQRCGTAAVIQQIDAVVKTRYEKVTSYTVTEHYAICRNKDGIHPVAEMTVKTTYRKNTGKSYTIVSQSGSPIMRDLS